MSFKERFEGKMSQVNKKGLKHTLFEKECKTSESYSWQQKYASNNPLPIYKKTIENQEESSNQNYRLSRRRSTNYDLHELKPPILTKIQTSENFIAMSSKLKAKRFQFLDEMLEKHKNLLRLIDKRSHYHKN